MGWFIISFINNWRPIYYSPKDFVKHPFVQLNEILCIKIMLTSLNSPQREAIKYLDGPLLVLAGAGSGKTRVITEKIGYLINQAGYNPKEVAAITFTNKAAREMQERVSKLMVGKNINVFYTTQTGYCINHFK